MSDFEKPPKEGYERYALRTIVYQFVDVPRKEDQELADMQEAAFLRLAAVQGCIIKLADDVEEPEGDELRPVCRRCGEDLPEDEFTSKCEPLIDGKLLRFDYHDHYEVEEYLRWKEAQKS